MMKIKTRDLAVSAVVGAAYAALTMLLAPISYGEVQMRVSEVLCILPFFLPGTTWGLFLGCALANVISAAGVWDVVFGSVATLLGALGTYLLRKTENPFLGCLPPIIANMLIVPAVLMKVYGAPETYWYLMLTVGIGEVACCGVLGVIVYKVIKKRNLL
jgi:uncharacterized membrane protein